MWHLGNSHWPSDGVKQLPFLPSELPEPSVEKQKADQAKPARSERDLTSRCVDARNQTKPPSDSAGVAGGIAFFRLAGAGRRPSNMLDDIKADYFRCSAPRRVVPSPCKAVSASISHLTWRGRRASDWMSNGSRESTLRAVTRHV